jgi:hypothetical protein
MTDRRRNRAPRQISVRGDTYAKLKAAAAVKGITIAQFVDDALTPILDAAAPPA